MDEQDGFRVEAALQFGFQMTNDDGDEYACTEAELIAFARMCERAGLVYARDLSQRASIHGLVDDLNNRITVLDADIVVRS